MRKYRLCFCPHFKDSNNGSNTVTILMQLIIGKEIDFETGENLQVSHPILFYHIYLGVFCFESQTGIKGDR